MQATATSGRVHNSMELHPNISAEQYVCFFSALWLSTGNATGSTTNPQWGCVRNCLQHNMRPGVCILVQSCSVPLACRRINMWQTRSHITDQTRGLHRVSGLLLGLSIFAALNWHVHFGTSRAMRGNAWQIFLHCWCCHP